MNAIAATIQILIAAMLLGGGVFFIIAGVAPRFAFIDTSPMPAARWRLAAIAVGLLYLFFAVSTIT